LLGWRAVLCEQHQISLGYESRAQSVKKRIAICFLAVILLIGAGIVVAGCSKGDSNNNGNNSATSSENSNTEPAVPKGVGAITSNNQVSGNTTFTNYLVKITNDIDWNTITKEEKQAIIDYAFYEVGKRNDAKNIKYYNITGVVESGESAFMYDRVNDEMVTLKNGQEEYRFSPPAKK